MARSFSINSLLVYSPWRGFDPTRTSRRALRSNQPLEHEPGQTQTRDHTSEPSGGPDTTGRPAGRVRDGRRRGLEPRRHEGHEKEPPGPWSTTGALDLETSRCLVLLVRAVALFAPVAPSRFAPVLPLRVQMAGHPAGVLESRTPGSRSTPICRPRPAAHVVRPRAMSPTAPGRARAALLLIMAATAAGCAASGKPAPRSPADDFGDSPFLPLVPADTPYVMANFKPLPASYANRFASMFELLRVQLLRAPAGSATDLLLAITEEIGPRFDARRAEELGLSVRPRVAFY